MSYMRPIIKDADTLSNDLRVVANLDALLAVSSDARRQSSGNALRRFMARLPKARQQTVQ